MRCLGEAGINGHLPDDVELVVSELVANAVRHAATDLTVSFDITDERVRVEVFDGDTRPPELLAAGPDARSGRGLVIVASVAATWGYEAAERESIRGKTVWAEFER
jgi:anti-sigma regulatory factor (Ser/Thr protein kinase)